MSIDTTIPVRKITYNGAELALAKTGINPEWTGWQYFSHKNNRNDLVSKLKYDDTSNGTDFSNMFRGCSTLPEIPLLDTSKGTNFSYMFAECSALTEIPLLDTSKGTNFSYMLQMCTKLKNIPLLDTSNGTNFAGMLNSCSKVETFPNIDTSNGTNFNGMFAYSSDMKVAPNIDTSKGTDFGNMFQPCSDLVTIPKINISNVASASKAKFVGNGTTKLENITFEGIIPVSLDMRYCKLLTHDSLMSAINALYDYSTDTSGTTHTLTIGSDNITKLTEEEQEIARMKGWTLA